VARIVSICSEPNVYEWLFREPLGGCPYEETKAREWLQWSNDGWSSGTHFVFAVIDDQKCVVAACDIKSNNPIAEIGYWASQWHRGVITNAVISMCTLAADAGFRELFARTKKENYRSQAVLQRAGFKKSASHDGGEERFTLLLRPEKQTPNY
jgi:RimJ/RimL family protein N-acetyltransferase